MSQPPFDMGQIMKQAQEMGDKLKRLQEEYGSAGIERLGGPERLQDTLLEQDETLFEQYEALRQQAESFYQPTHE